MKKKISLATLAIYGMILGGFSAAQSATAREKWERLPLPAVQVTGELGARQALQQREVLHFTRLRHDKRPGALDWDADILRTWTARLTVPELNARLTSTYTGLGKTLVALCQYVAATRDSDLMRRKEQIVASLIRSQDDDGYIGTIKRDASGVAFVWQVWNVHDGVYVGLGLVEDYLLFGNRAALSCATRYAVYFQVDP